MNGLAVNLDEVVEETLRVSVRERSRSGRFRTRIAPIRDYVPMRVWNRHLRSVQQRPEQVSSLEMLRWMAQQVALVWQLSEPEMTAYRLACSLAYEQIQALYLRFFHRPAPEAAMQSLERLNYATRQGHGGSGAIPISAMHSQPLVSEEWDEEARQNQLREADRIEHRDPETAAFLRQQALASLAHARAQAGAETGTTPEALPGVSAAYNPAQLYARMGELYHWMSKDVIDAMHAPTFFMYVRVAVLAREQQKAQATYGALNAQSSPEELRAYFGNPARTFS